VNLDVIEHLFNYVKRRSDAGVRELPLEPDIPADGDRSRERSSRIEWAASRQIGGCGTDLLTRMEARRWQIAH
jgi:hypothetical protein